MADTAIESPKLESIVDQLFNGDASSTYTLRYGDKAGTVVKFRTAKFKEIASITRALSELVSRLPRDKFAALISGLAADQLTVMTSGGSKESLDLAVQNQTKAFLGDSQSIGMALASCFDLLPRMMSVFCDLPQDAIDNLEIDDAIMVMVGILGCNYGFFTQRFAPLLGSVLAGLKTKTGSDGAKTPGTPAAKLVEVAPTPVPQS